MILMVDFLLLDPCEYGIDSGMCADVQPWSRGGQT